MWYDQSLIVDPSAVVSPSEAVATVGHSVTFTCNVSGDPLPTISHWTLSDDPTHYTIADKTRKSRVKVRCTASSRLAFILFVHANVTCRCEKHSL